MYPKADTILTRWRLACCTKNAVLQCHCASAQGPSRPSVRVGAIYSSFLEEAVRCVLLARSVAKAHRARVGARRVAAGTKWERRTTLCDQMNLYGVTIHDCTRRFSWKHLLFLFPSINCFHFEMVNLYSRVAAPLLPQNSEMHLGPKK